MIMREKEDGVNNKNKVKRYATTLFVDVFFHFFILSSYSMQFETLK